MLSQLFSSNNDNCSEIVKISLFLLREVITNTPLQKDLQLNLDYSSLLRSSDVFIRHGIEKGFSNSSFVNLGKISIPFVT